MHIPVHPLWLPLYIYVTQTVHVKLTMAGLFRDRPPIPDYLLQHFLSLSHLVESLQVKNAFLSSLCAIFTPIIEIHFPV